jgi:hypothetical protein
MLTIDRDFIELDGNKKVTIAQLAKLECRVGYVCMSSPNVRGCSPHDDRRFFEPSVTKRCRCGGGACTKRPPANSDSKLIFVTIQWIRGLGPLAGSVQSTGRIEGLRRVFEEAALL